MKNQNDQNDVREDETKTFETDVPSNSEPETDETDTQDSAAKA